MPTETCIKDKNINKNYNWDYYTKLKYVGEIRGRIGFRGYNVEDTVDEGTDGAAIVLGGTNIMKDGTINYEKLTYLSEKKYLESPEIMLKGGEILITKVGAGTGENALYEYYQERVTINPNVMLFIASDKVYPKYINYVLLNDDIKKEIAIEATKSGAQPAINQNYIENMKLILPNKSEQQAIADFLDEKCKKIDKVVSEIEEQIQVLEDYKKSLITEIVTKGLDKNVPMKDSGINWIGKIPANWKISKIKYEYNIQTGGTPDTSISEYYDGENKWVTIADINEKVIYDTESKITKSAIKSCSMGISPKDSLLFSFKLSIGKVAFCGENLYTNEAIATFLKGVQPLQYLYYAAPIFIVKNANENIYGAKLLNQQLIKDAPIVLPPAEEQIKMADYLDKECEKIDKTINDKKEQLETIKEYKKSLIYEYVTGKKRVAC